MRIKCLLIFVMNITIARAQQIHLQGSVFDEQSALSIANATISIQSKNLFFPCDDAGKFDFTSDKLINTDSVAFSCIGYQTKTIKLSDILPNCTVRLAVLVNVLKEVKISSKPPALINVGSKMRSEDMYSSYLPGMEQAMFIEGSESVKGIIQKVGFYLGNGRLLSNNVGDVTAPFRIRLYEADSGGMPGKELTKDVIVISARKNNAWFDVDISDYHIENPGNGFFAAFCLLDEGFYQVKKGYTSTLLGTAVNSRYIFTPRLGAKKNEFKNVSSYTGTNGALGWHWHKDPFNYSYMIRASIAE